MSVGRIFSFFKKIFEPDRGRTKGLECLSVSSFGRERYFLLKIIWGHFLRKCPCCHHAVSHFTGFLFMLLLLLSCIQWFSSVQNGVILNLEWARTTAEIRTVLDSPVHNFSHFFISKHMIFFFCSLHFVVRIWDALIRDFLVNFLSHYLQPLNCSHSWEIEVNQIDFLFKVYFK